MQQVKKWHTYMYVPVSQKEAQITKSWIVFMEHKNVMDDKLNCPTSPNLRVAICW